MNINFKKIGKYVVGSVLLGLIYYSGFIVNDITDKGQTQAYQALEDHNKCLQSNINMFLPKTLLEQLASAVVMKEQEQAEEYYYSLKRTTNVIEDYFYINGVKYGIYEYYSDCYNL